MSSLDLDTPFQLAEVHLVVQVAGVEDDLDGGDVVDSEPLALGQALHRGLVEVVEDRVHLALHASHLPYHRACRRGFHLGCYPAYRGESLQVHRQVHSRPKGHQPTLVEPFVRLFLQRRTRQEGRGVEGDTGG